MTTGGGAEREERAAYLPGNDRDPKPRRERVTRLPRKPRDDSGVRRRREQADELFSRQKERSSGSSAEEFC